jgi:hypothetical protein
MKNYLYILPGGGIFSRILQFGIIPLADIDFDNVHLQIVGFAPPDDPTDEFSKQAYKICCDHYDNMTKYGIMNIYQHITNYALYQPWNDTYEYKGFLPRGTLYTNENPIENSTRLLDYKRVLSKLTIEPEIISKVDQFVSDYTINTRTLGVHVRMTTMNMLHQDLYQPVTIDDYIRTIKKEYGTDNYDSIFVASDNHESIAKIKKYFGGIVTSHSDFLRFEHEQVDSFLDCIDEYDWFYQKKFWQETFQDCIVLSKCGGLICRESNFSNMAIVFSDTFKNIVRLTHE